ncbi:hypothetical protein EAH79_11815 [Sphingomonas koreensis]|nr:hypothetical protein EAH79_11815 [Sphingomonas koreensis]
MPMPIKTAPEPEERAKIEAALKRLRANTPEVAAHKTRARRGSLQTNLHTLANESGVRRHRIEKLYPDLAAAAAADRGEPSSSVPLRDQRDAARRDKKEAERQLEQSQTYNYRLMELVSKLRAEKQLLNERVAELEAGLGRSDIASEFFLGTDTVVGIPPMPARPRKRAGRSGTRI